MFLSSTTRMVLLLTTLTSTIYGFQIHNGNGRVVFRNPRLSAVSAEDYVLSEEDCRMRMARNIVNAETWSKQAAVARQELEALKSTAIVQPSEPANAVELGSVAESQPEVVMRLSEEEKRMQWAMQLQECKPELAQKAEHVQQTLNGLVDTTAAVTKKSTQPRKQQQQQRANKKPFVSRKFIHAY